VVTFRKMSAASWSTNIGAPALGTVICNVMWLSPMSAILAARRKRDLETLNPIPFAVTVCNCVAWTMYSCMRRDYFIFWSNGTGLCLGLFYSLISLVLLSRRRKDEGLLSIMLGLMLSTAIFWCLMAMIACIVYADDTSSKEQGINFIGTLGMAFSLAYYASPLSVMLHVLKSKDSSTLYMPLILSSLVNAIMWVVYGYVAKNDINIWVPNAVGVALTSFQVLLKLSYTSRPSALAGDQIPPQSNDNTRDVTANPLQRDLKEEEAEEDEHYAETSTKI
jgi:solute carrier family 50 (sugar transporter)